MLYVCATPLGNLEDITLRTLRIFQEVDYILCEDTRRTIKLLNHYEIKKKLISMNEHSEFHKKNHIIDDLKAGKNIALVSDAGMPGIQDPGQQLIQEAIKNNVEYTILPGPSALITALVGSGMCQDEFVFLGFLPRKQSERKEILNRYASVKAELVLYESPHRFAKLLEDLMATLGDRNIVICRELSKRFEEYIHTTVNEAIEKQQDIQGELVIIIQRGEELNHEMTEQDLIQIAKGMSEGKTSKQLSKELIQKTGISKNRAYEIALQIKNESK